MLWWFIYGTWAKHRYLINHMLVSVYFGNLRLMKKEYSVPWKIFFSAGPQFPSL